MRKNKKAIGVVVVTALLLVIAVSAIIGFQAWYNSFSSNIYAKNEQRAGGDSLPKIEGIIDNTLFVQNKQSSNFTINEIKIGGKNCNQEINLTPGINEINITSCLIGVEKGKTEIALITSKGIISYFDVIN